MSALRALETLIQGPGSGRDSHERAETSDRVSHVSDRWDALRDEIMRSRRYGREFALIRIKATLPRGLGGLARSLASRLRATDSTWCASGSVYVLLPESDVGAGEALIERLQREDPSLVSHEVAVAAFPGDGVTSGALLAALVASNDRRIEKAEPATTPLVARRTAAHAQSR